MNAKKANWLYFVIIVVTLLMVAMINILYLTDGVELTILLNNLFSESAALLPALAFVLLSGDRLGDIIPIKPIRIQTALLIPVVLMLVFPMIMVINSITMLFVDNTVISISGQILSEPIWVMLLSIGLFAPFAEEIVCRGVFFHSYRKSGRVLGAAILSALIFGLIHLNINQTAYAFFIGLVFALMVEATGSILTTMIAHALFNSFEVLLMYGEESILSGGMEMAQEMLAGSGMNGYLLNTITTLIVPAICSCGAAFLVIYLMSILQKRPDALTGMFGMRKKTAPQTVYAQGSQEMICEIPADGVVATDTVKPALVTAPLIAGFILTGLYIAYTTFIIYFYR